MLDRKHLCLSLIRLIDLSFFLRGDGTNWSWIMLNLLPIDTMLQYTALASQSFRIRLQMINNVIDVLLHHQEGHSEVRATALDPQPLSSVLLLVLSSEHPSVFLLLQPTGNGRSDTFCLLLLSFVLFSLLNICDVYLYFNEKPKCIQQGRTTRARVFLSKDKNNTNDEKQTNRTERSHDRQVTPPFERQQRARMNMMVVNVFCGRACHLFVIGLSLASVPVRCSEHSTLDARCMFGPHVMR